jgi:hypothetical protein
MRIRTKMQREERATEDAENTEEKPLFSAVLCVLCVLCGAFS